VADLSGPLRRRQYGRNHAYFFGDQKVPGVTTIIGIRDKAGLKKWAAGVAAELVANAARVKDGKLTIDGDDLWAEMRALDDKLPMKPSLPKLVDGLTWAHNKSRDIAANRGTEVHRYAEELTGGAQVDVPEPLVGHVDAYIDWWDTWQPTNTRSEVSVGSRQWGGWGGTLDLLCDIDGLGRCLVDIKTSQSGVYGDTALQMAGYRYAQVALDGDGNEEPMPEVDWCGVLWLRADGWDLFPFRVGPAEERLFAYCRGVYALWQEPFAELWPGPGDRPRYADMAWGDSVKGQAIRPEDVRRAS
jgi:hypothetical protein